MISSTYSTCIYRSISQLLPEYSCFQELYVVQLLTKKFFFLAEISQKIYPKVSKTSCGTFTLTGWAKSENVVLTNPSPDNPDGSASYSSFGLAAKIKYKGVDALEIHSVEFDPNFSSWQEVSLQVHPLLMQE